MILYHHLLSSNARRATMTALHLAPHLREPVSLQLVDLTTGAQQAPSYLQLNPAGKVPVLTDGDFSLSESPAIMVYLADNAPGQTLWPTDPKARADVNRWLFWCAAHFMPAVATLNWERFVKRLVSGQAADPARVAQGEADFHTHARLLDTHLANRDWVSGDTLSLADFSLAAPLMHEGTAGLPLTDYPHLRAWWDRVRALPAWQATEPPPMG